MTRRPSLRAAGAVAPGSGSACRICRTTVNPGDGVGFAAWPAYRVSSGELWSVQRRLDDCFRRQRWPCPGYASDVTVALGVDMGVNAKGAESVAPFLKR